VFVRRTITAYALSLGVLLLILSGGLVPEATWSGDSPDDVYDGQANEPAPETDPPSPVTATGEPAVRQVRLDAGEGDIPLTALLAYRGAADVMGEAKASCGLSWPLLAAIGRVESDHGRADGARLGEDGVSTPTRGAPGGLGPMRFFPSVWRMVAVDGDGDGVRNPHDIDDAALAVAVYLCAPGEDLRGPAAKRAAVRTYDDARRYVELVLAYEEMYRSGEFLVSASSGAARPASVVLKGPRLDATPLGGKSPAAARIRDRVSKQVRHAMTRAAETVATSRGASPSAAPATKTTQARPSTKPQAPATTPSTTQAGGSTPPAGSPATGSPAGGPSGGADSPAPPPTGPATSPTTPSESPEPPSGGGTPADEPTESPDADPCTVDDEDAEPLPGTPGAEDDAASQDKSAEVDPSEGGADPGETNEDEARCEPVETPTPSPSE
jgi:hypothetical protein